MNKSETPGLGDSMEKGYDVRGIANIILDEARKSGVKMTNLHLNKALFFMHVDFIAQYARPLVSAKIEAWEYGPVFREIYNLFKKFGRREICELATKVDYETGCFVVADANVSGQDEAFIRHLAKFYSGMPASLLVEMSHERGGTWDVVWHHKGALNVGMEITRELIEAHELPKRRVKRS